MCLKYLWIVWKPYLVINTIGTDRVLSGLLQVDNYAYIQAKQRKTENINICVC